MRATLADVLSFAHMDRAHSRAHVSMPLCKQTRAMIIIARPLLHFFRSNTHTDRDSLITWNLRSEGNRVRKHVSTLHFVCELGACITHTHIMVSLAFCTPHGFLMPSIAYVLYIYIYIVLLMCVCALQMHLRFNTRRAALVALRALEPCDL